MVRLGDVCEISSSKANLTDDKIWLLNLDMVEQQTGKIISYYYVNKNELNGSITQFDTENILYSKLRPNLNKVVVPDRNGFSTSELLPLKPNSKILCREYLALYLRSDSFVSWAISKTAGAKMPRLGTKALLDKEIPLPPLDEQRRIAATLDKVTDLISKRRQQLDKLDELVKARFVEMFGDPVKNPMKWSVHCFSEYIEFLTSGSRGWAKYFTEQGEYFITIKNVKNCRITVDNVQHISPPDNAEAKRTKVQEGDLLISITADLGRTGVISKEIADHGAYINQHLTCIRVKKDCLNPVYAAYYLESEAGKSQFQSKNQSAVKAGLNFNAINSLQLMVPPLTLQNTFVDFVDQTEKTKVTISRSLEKLETLKKALMYEYFG